MDHQAFAQLLGNYGEFIGAIAVVITLAYLATQIRQNTEQMRLSSYQTSDERYSALMANVLQDPDKFSAFRAALNGYNSGTAQQQALFHSQVYNAIRAVQHSQQLFAVGAIPKQLLIEQKTDVARVLKSPGGWEWMNANGVDPESEFYKEVFRVGADEPPLNQVLSFFADQSSEAT